MIRRWGPWIALGLVVVIALAVVLWPSGDRSRPPRAPHDLETELRCPECSGLSVADSQAPTSRGDPHRHQAAHRGRTERRRDPPGLHRQVRRVDPACRRRAPGVGLLVWVLPSSCSRSGATGIVFALRANRDEPRLHATEADERLVDARSSGDG